MGFPEEYLYPSIKNKEDGIIPSTMMDSKLTNVLGDYLETRERQVAICANLERSVVGDDYTSSYKYRLSHKFPYKRVDISYDTYTPWAEELPLEILKDPKQYRPEGKSTFFIKSTMVNKALVCRLMLFVMEDWGGLFELEAPMWGLVRDEKFYSDFQYYQSGIYVHS